MYNLKRTADTIPVTIIQEKQEVSSCQIIITMTKHQTIPRTTLRIIPRIVLRTILRTAPGIALRTILTTRARTALRTVLRIRARTVLRIIPRTAPATAAAS